MGSCAQALKNTHYFFPPEILPRLASRGIIEVEKQKATLFEHGRKKLNAKARFSNSAQLLVGWWLALHWGMAVTSLGLEWTQTRKRDTCGAARGLSQIGLSFAQPAFFSKRFDSVTLSGVPVLAK